MSKIWMGFREVEELLLLLPILMSPLLLVVASWIDFMSLRSREKRLPGDHILAANCQEDKTREVRDSSITVSGKAAQIKTAKFGK
jgi:hypothetical protein